MPTEVNMETDKKKEDINNYQEVDDLFILRR